MNPLLKLIDHGQSYWIDNLTRPMLTGGKLRHRVEREGLRGMTSNPSTFQKAIADAADYDEQIIKLIARRPAPDIRGIAEALMIADIQSACDILLPVYEQSAGLDGYVSLEVPPHYAYHAEASVQIARRLFQKTNRQNLFIKIPGTKPGLAAIEQLLFEGINVNITLLFSVERYESVAEAYLRALERRAEEKLPLDTVDSVASFFLSRIDVAIDQLLEQRLPPANGLPPLSPNPAKLLGKAAVANAKLAYQSFKRITASERWRVLAGRGAKVQRLLWASTSTKNPHYDDLMYVAPLIGPHTVNTMPEKTIKAFADHGVVRDTVEEGLDEARQVMGELAALGIDFGQVTAQLESEGVQKFIDPYNAMLATLADVVQQHLNIRDIGPLEAMARQIRRDIITMTTEAGSGHPTSSLSSADIVTALFFRQMRWDPSAPEARDVDAFVLSKGHAAPVLWAALHEAGAIQEDIRSLRKLGSTLEGHPTPLNPWVKVATGSLGQGLAAANGMALANRLDGIPAKVYCLLGDGECSEGAVWEAAQFAALHKLSGLVAIVDVNGLEQSTAAPYGHDTGVFAQRFRAFGWQALEIDGHDMVEILEALYQAGKGGTAPTAILARTVKGKGVSFLEGEPGWHGKALDQEQMARALRELGEVEATLQVEPRRIDRYDPAEPSPKPRLALDYRAGDSHATRKAFGEALRQLGEGVPELVVLDGDVKNSTYTEFFAQAFPKRFFQGHIAEQNLVGTALGLAVCGKIPVLATFAAFLSRAYDFIRMAAHSQPPHLVFCGSHAGVSIGEDGPSQMGLEDLAMFRALPGTTVLYPCDAVSAARLTTEALATPGIVYVRTTRAATPVIYGNDEAFPVGGSKTLRESGRDLCAVVAAGITLHEALAAADGLQKDGVAVRVIDAYSVKPLDVETLRRAALETSAVLVVEDHWADGGLGDAVAVAVSEAGPVHRLGVAGRPRSGTPEELLDALGISRRAIARKVRELVERAE